MGFTHGLKAGDIITNSELTTIFVCAPQGGMRRSRNTDCLVVISDHTKSIYEDRWVANDTIHYSGIGLEGDQRIDIAPNKTLAESTGNGVTPYLFEVYESGKYLFRGQVSLAGEPYQETQPDRSDTIRNVWVFPLRVVGPDAAYEVPADLIGRKQRTKARLARRLSDKDLFTRAVHSRRQPVNRKVASTTYERNAYVAELARRRADGRCQLCGRTAPFETRQGEPYLEIHHIDRLSRGGSDTIENTVALCPNCHRKMHLLNLKSDRNALREEGQKTCCQLTFSGEMIFV